MEVASLFADHPDLLEEFVLFLPENEAAVITSKLVQGGLAPPGMGGVVRETKAPIIPAAAPKRPAQPPLPPSKTAKRARHAAAMTNRTAEESAFYERVKRYLGDKQAYAEFLKCLNLFCQDIIKMSDLVHLVHRFIGTNAELFGWFKRYIGYKDAVPDGVAPGSAWRMGTPLVNEQGELNLSACRKTGSSYRIYPKAHILPKSSHRTPVGLENLNDTMVCCPVFNSEDSTFVASKKNQYEEALFRCEDERFEMDLLIEYNLATIAVFEPLARKVEAMTAEEKAQLTLGPTLGGTSVVIYRKAIRKIYGEKADEVITGLMKHPATAVPVVLRRLKQKDEEWRRVQRDWNRIWRDIHVKNYYKALDHQGIEFRAADRRNIAGRTLISELEAVAGERRRAIERGDVQPPHHLEYGCKNLGELTDHVMALIRSYVKSAPAFTGNDRKGVLRFLGSFLPGLFALATVAVPVPTDQVVSLAEAAAPSDEENISASASDSDSGADVMEPKVEAEDFITKATEKNPTPSQTTPILLFANNNLYVLVRLVQMAMERLDKMQAASRAANGAPFFTEKRNVVASFLDLQTQAQSQLGASNGEISGDFYRTLLILLKQLVASSLDVGVFEERVRFMFGTAAYPIFTFDKLLQALVKQVQIVLSDGSCEQLVRLFDSWNSRKTAMRLSEYSVRMAAETAVGSREPLYRIEFTPKTGRLTIQLLERLAEGGSGTTAESRWSAYVDSFVKLESNPRYLDPKSRIYLLRNRRREPIVVPGKLHVQYNLECKIAINTYKLFYVENTEDYLLRAGQRVLATRKVADRRYARWIQSLAPENQMDAN
jgi:paired amphipathic helix protein Sin3a